MVGEGHAVEDGDDLGAAAHAYSVAERLTRAVPLDIAPISSTWAMTSASISSSHSISPSASTICSAGLHPARDPRARGRGPDHGPRRSDREDVEEHRQSATRDWVLDAPDVIIKKLKSAKTDSRTAVDPEDPGAGVHNLLSIYHAFVGGSRDEALGRFTGQG